MEFKSINDLEKWFCKNKGDIVKFNFDLSNCLHLIMEGYQQGSFYCFCDKNAVSFWKRKDEWFGKISYNSA